MKMCMFGKNKISLIAVLVDPNQTPKPRCTIEHEELVNLCRRLTGIAY